MHNWGLVKSFWCKLPLLLQGWIWPSNPENNILAGAIQGNRLIPTSIFTRHLRIKSVTLLIQIVHYSIWSLCWWFMPLLLHKNQKLRSEIIISLVLLHCIRALLGLSVFKLHIYKYIIASNTTHMRCRAHGLICKDWAMVTLTVFWKMFLFGKYLSLHFPFYFLILSRFGIMHRFYKYYLRLICFVWLS